MNDELAVAVVIAGVVIGLGLLFGGDKHITEGGLKGHDLELAVIRCKPPSATFEQSLACFRAVYGSN